MPVDFIMNYNNWGLDLYNTHGYLIKKNHNENFYRYYSQYLNPYWDMRNILTGETAMFRQGIIAGAKMQTHSPQVSASLTVNFEYKTDESIKYSSFVSRVLGDLTGSGYAPITTVEGAEPRNRSYVYTTARQYWYRDTSVETSGYIYLAYIKDNNLESLEALPPTTEFSKITRTFEFNGGSSLDVRLVSDIKYGYIGITKFTSVVETTDPEETIISYNTFDTATTFTPYGANVPKYEHQIKDLSKAGKFRLKSARLG